MKSNGKFIPFFPAGSDPNPALVVPALLEWTVLLGELKHVRDGLDAMEIATVEAFCWYATPEFVSAGFIVHTADKRRFHLHCSMEERTWDFSSLTSVQIGRDDPLPSPPIAGGPASMRWHTEVDPYNKGLKEHREDFMALAS
ncbi:MAG: hypothetical protein WCP68_09720 [Enhydrobacter sp.]